MSEKIEIKLRRDGRKKGGFSYELVKRYQHNGNIRYANNLSLVAARQLVDQHGKENINFTTSNRAANKLDGSEITSAKWVIGA